MPIISVNNINLYYEVHGSGPPLLFIHGLGASTRDWEYQLPAFSNQYQVIVFDLRGHGKSDKPKMSYTVSLLAEDTAALIRHLCKGPISVVGHSLGGMVAFQLALDHPDLVKNLTIINSAPAVIFPRIRDNIRFFLRGISVRLFGMQKLSTSLAKILFPKPEQSALRETFIQRWCENDPEAYINTLHAFRGWNVMPRLSELQCPTLIITADNDYTPVSFKEFYAKFIRNNRVVVIKDSRHITIADQPVAFNRCLADFLEKSR